MKFTRRGILGLIGAAPLAAFMEFDEVAAIEEVTKRASEFATEDFLISLINEDGDEITGRLPVVEINDRPTVTFERDRSNREVGVGHRIHLPGEPFESLGFTHIDVPFSRGVRTQLCAAPVTLHFADNSIVKFSA